jgi:hypothetical protein
MEGGAHVKIISRGAIALLILLSVPVIYGQDLSKYRTFSLGTTLADLSKQLEPDSYKTKTTLIHQRPAVIQEMSFWVMGRSSSEDKADSVSEILFSFYNGTLYRILVIYDQKATEGLTAEDMVQAVSAQYGTATRPKTDISFPTKASYESKEKIIARWEDSQNSVNLFHSGTLGSFGLVLLSKRLDAEAEAAIIESVKLEKEEAPQKEIEHQKKEADDLEVARQKNKKTFRP